MKRSGHLLGTSGGTTHLTELNFPEPNLRPFAGRDEAKRISQDPDDDIRVRREHGGQPIRADLPEDVGTRNVGWGQWAHARPGSAEKEKENHTAGG